MELDGDAEVDTEGGGEPETELRGDRLAEDDSELVVVEVAACVARGDADSEDVMLGCNGDGDDSGVSEPRDEAVPDDLAAAVVVAPIEALEMPLEVELAVSTGAGEREPAGEALDDVEDDDDIDECVDGVRVDAADTDEILVAPEDVERETDTVTVGETLADALEQPDDSGDGVAQADVESVVVGLGDKVPDGDSESAAEEVERGDPESSPEIVAARVAREERLTVEELQGETEAV